MRYTPDEVMQFIEEEDAKFIRLAFRDAYGVQKNISIMPGELKKAFDEGISIGAGEIAGFTNAESGRLYLIPDPSTLAILPWRPDSGRVVRMFCDVYTPDGKPFEADTRRILQEAVTKADEAGVDFRFGSASEFYLFKKDEDTAAEGKSAKKLSTDTEIIRKYMPDGSFLILTYQDGKIVDQRRTKPLLVEKPDLSRPTVIKNNGQEEYQTKLVPKKPLFGDIV